MKKSIFLLAFLYMLIPAFAQERVPSALDSARSKMGMIAHNPLHSPDTMMHHSSMHMASAFSKNLPMSRNGSGTGWLPDASPMSGAMFHSNKWMYMLHGNLFLRYTNQNFNNEKI